MSLLQLTNLWPPFTGQPLEESEPISPPMFGIADVHRGSAFVGDGLRLSRVSTDSVRMIGIVPDQHRAQ